ncbi:5394_t:CDS:10 [Acaulospora morrowiae]|uniref:DNA primase n=1 Tax=Acaulospora morrowiae TaxID=94023 RepID=A0A9N8VE95_9GLOM|nr:5394_t:CDS:10 [Acaulospora morrowiae]
MDLDNEPVNQEIIRSNSDVDTIDKMNIDQSTNEEQSNVQSQDTEYIPDTPELLHIFYSKIFPYKTYAYWLNYGKEIDKPFLNREFSLQLPTEAVIRNLSFSGPDEMKTEILKFCPSKFDVGAVYTAKPKDKKSLRPSAFKPVEKELVFDIDMTDYDDIRTCCSGGDICNKCWQFMTVAIKILDVSLRGAILCLMAAYYTFQLTQIFFNTEDFGFKHLLWIYSGRRGVHCWVSDERARKLNNEERKAIVAYLEVVKGGAQQSKKVRLYKTLHPSLSRSLEIIEKYFEQVILEDQDVLQDEKNWTKVLNCIPDEGVKKKLHDNWLQSPKRSSVDKWNDLEYEVQYGAAKKASKKLESLQMCTKEIMFQYLYPRLDEKVTTQINHLLKSPFCVHPKTGRVCVTISPENCEYFNPLEVPTLTMLYRQLNESYANKTDGKRIRNDYDVTSLKPYIKYFENFVESIVSEVREKNRAKEVFSMEF